MLGSNTFFLSAKSGLRPVEVRSLSSVRVRENLLGQSPCEHPVFFVCVTCASTLRQQCVTDFPLSCGVASPPHHSHIIPSPQPPRQTSLSQLTHIIPTPIQAHSPEHRTSAETLHQTLICKSFGSDLRGSKLSECKEQKTTVSSSGFGDLGLPNRRNGNRGVSMRIWAQRN